MNRSTIALTVSYSFTEGKKGSKSGYLSESDLMVLMAFLFPARALHLLTCRDVNFTFIHQQHAYLSYRLVTPFETSKKIISLALASANSDPSKTAKYKVMSVLILTQQYFASDVT